MRHWKSFDSNISNFKQGDRAEKPAIKSRFGLILNSLLSWPIAINRDMKFLGQRDQSLHMIGMFVGHEDSGQVLRHAANDGQPLANLASAQPRIDQQPGLVGFDVGAIAGGTAAENSQANSHRLTLMTQADGGNAFRKCGSISDAIAQHTFRSRENLPR